MSITTFAHGDSYFSSHFQNPQNPELDTLFYLSFEDALWDFLLHKVEMGSTLLFPDFFCMDVLDNCIVHGYKVELYPTQDDLQNNPKFLYDRIGLYQPSVIFIFHALGIQNTLLTKKLFDTYSGYIIEDSVHRIVVPTEIKLFSPEHIIINSTRKLTPLPGSQIWASKGVLDYPQQLATDQTEMDGIKALRFWSEFQSLIQSQDFDKVSYAYQLLNSGDNLIGDSVLSVRLDNKYLISRSFLNLQAITESKHQQYLVYIQLLKNILIDERFTITDLYSDLDKLTDYGGLLAFFPLAMKSDYTFFIKDLLNQNQIQTFIEFSDSPWAADKNVLCLPIGPHVTLIDISKICSLIVMWYLERSKLVHEIH